MRKRVYIAGPISKGDLTTNVNRATEAFIALAKAGFAPLCPHWSVYSKPAEQVWQFQGETSDGFPQTVPCEDRCECTGTRNGNDQMGHTDWMGVDLPWVAVSDAVLRLPGESSGADQEEACAREHGVPVFTELAALLGHFEAEAGVA